jgi:hypothetical protein
MLYEFDDKRDVKRVRVSIKIEFKGRNKETLGG